MALHEINCEDCGAPRQTLYKNTKFCRQCRLLRNISYPFAPRVCGVEGCSEKFMPIARKDYLCPKHAFDSRNEIDCSFCHEPGAWSVLDDLKVCTACARDPKFRALFIRALARKQQERIDEFRGTVQAAS